MKPPTQDLTIQELHFLTVLLTGIIDPDIKNVSALKLRILDKDKSDTVVVYSRNGKSIKIHVKQETITSLVKMRLIHLVPPIVNRYTYIGRWVVTQYTFQKHPQYNEIIAQAALGT